MLETSDFHVNTKLRNSYTENHTNHNAVEFRNTSGIDTPLVQRGWDFPGFALSLDARRQKLMDADEESEPVNVDKSPNGLISAYSDGV